MVGSEPVSGLASQSDTPEQARSRLSEAIRFFIDSCYERGTLEQVLSDHQFTLQLAPASPDAAVRQGPPPEVIFSAPLPDDVDVAQDTTVRVQFSRDMDPDSCGGQVRVAYARPGATEPDADAAGILFELAYRGRNRVLEIRFVQELERFRSVVVELLEGVTANDGTPLPPWTMSFFTGG